MGMDMCVQGRMYVEHMSAPVQVNVYACSVDINMGCRYTWCEYAYGIMYTGTGIYEWVYTGLHK